MFLICNIYIRIYIKSFSLPLKRLSCQIVVQLPYKLDLRLPAVIQSFIYLHPVLYQTECKVLWKRAEYTKATLKYIVRMVKLNPACRHSLAKKNPNKLFFWHNSICLPVQYKSHLVFYHSEPLFFPIVRSATA